MEKVNQRISEVIVSLNTNYMDEQFEKYKKNLIEGIRVGIELGQEFFNDKY